MALTIQRSVQRGPDFHSQMAAMQRRLKTATRDISPVITHFSKSLRLSIRKNFRDGGTVMGKWAPNSRNTVAGKKNAKPLIGKVKPYGGIEKSVRMLTVYAPPSRYVIDVQGTQVGEYHMNGMKRTIIYPRKKKWLRFQVAEEHSVFLQRRKKALASRRAGKDTKIPSRAKAIWVFAKMVKHPGYPARRWVVIDNKLIADHYRAPMRAFLFEGKDPS